MFPAHKHYVELVKLELRRSPGGSSVPYGCLCLSTTPRGRMFNDKSAGKDSRVKNLLDVAFSQADPPELECFEFIHLRSAASKTEYLMDRTYSRLEILIIQCLYLRSIIVFTQRSQFLSLENIFT